jgi:hypothetical protein
VPRTGYSRRRPLTVPGITTTPGVRPLSRARLRHAVFAVFRAVHRPLFYLYILSSYTSLFSLSTHHQHYFPNLSPPIPNYFLPFPLTYTFLNLSLSLTLP